MRTVFKVKAWELRDVAIIVAIGEAMGYEHTLTEGRDVYFRTP